MSDVEYVVSETTKLESRLRKELGATGNGLGGLYASTSRYFENSDAARRRLDTIVSERNKVVHDGRKNLENPGEFIRAVGKFNRDITDAANVRNSVPFLQAVFPVLLFLLALLFVMGALLGTAD